MISYFLYLKFKWQFWERNSLSNILINWMTLLVLSIYGLLVGALINFSSRIDEEIFSEYMPFHFVNLAIFILTILRGFFPVYRTNIRVFPAHYPIPSWKRYLFSLSYDFSSPFFLGFFGFICLLNGVLNDDNLFSIISSLSVLAGAHLIRKIVQYFVDFRVKKIGYILLTSQSLFLFVLRSYIDLNNLVIYPVFTLILFITTYFIDNWSGDRADQPHSRPWRKGYYYLNMVLNNKIVFPLIIMIFLVKVMIISLDYVLFLRNGVHLFDVNIIFWVFSTPLILFTYIFNNTWGYFPSLWLAIYSRTTDFNALIINALKLYFWVLISDFLVTIPILAVSWREYRFIILFYLISLLFLLISSSICSILLPIKIKKMLQGSGGTSVLGSSLSSIPVFILYFSRTNEWFYYAVPFLLLILLLLYKATFRRYKSHRYKMAEILLEQ